MKTMYGKIIGLVIQKLADSEPSTTAAGAVLATVIAAQIDWVKVFEGDVNQVGNLVGALAVLILGYYTNHSKFKG